MTKFNLQYLFLFLFFIQQSITQIPPVVPLTNALTAIYCHDSNESGIMTIRCGSNEKIRMLDAFDVVVKNKSYLPLQCVKEKHFSLLPDNYSANVADCKVRTSFISACSGRENCTLHMQRIRLNNVDNNCHNELVDYTMAFFECISDVFIHDVCSSQAITSAWGTLKTPNFPNPYTSNDDCWCKLSTQLQHRLLLSVIVFQLIPYDQKCANAGLYLQSSDKQRSTQCTYLQQGHNYLSDTNSLYINFYSRTSTVRGGFWIVYEASHPNAEVHLHCGSQEKIGVPSTAFPVSPSPISSSYNYGWSRLAYNNPPNPTTLTNDHMMRMRLFVTTSRSLLETKSKKTPSTTVASAFTYPYGHLSTFELAYGPRGWFLKYPFGSSNMTVTRFLQTTTSQPPVVKWNSTWRYIRRLRPKTFITTTSTTKPTTTTIPTTTTTTTTTIITSTTTLETTTMVTSTILITEQSTIPISPTAISTTTLQNLSAQQRLLFSHNPWIYYNTGSTESFTTTIKPIIKSTMHVPIPSFTLKTTLPLPTPWYPPDGLWDWWQRQWYTTKSRKVLLEIHTTTQTATSTTTTTTITTNPTTTRSPLNLNNKTSTTTITPENKITADWFEWPHVEFTSTTKGRPDYDDEEYSEWPDYFPATKIPPEQQRQQFQQMSFFPTESNKQFNNRLLTNVTSPSKRDQTQQYIHGRNSIGSQSNDIIDVNPKDISEQIPGQENRRSFEENGWLSKTDMTIVAVSILFVISLVIINLILFAVRRHRHRVQGRHLLSSSSLNSRRFITNEHLQSLRHSIPSNSLINLTNNNNNDILPAVGEIVLWDEKDQGGYTIDNEGEWEKIDGHQWFGNNKMKNSRKTSFSKSFRSRFQFIRQSNKKTNNRPQQPPKSPQQTFKYPLLTDTTSLSPVLEVDDYRLSQISLQTPLKNSNTRHQHTAKTIQTLMHKEQDRSDEYYKRIETEESDSNYTTMHGNPQGEYSISDQQTNRSLGNEIRAGGSVIISVPTMFREEDNLDTTTDGIDSIYNQQYPIQSFTENKNIPRRSNNQTNSFATKLSTKNSIIVGYCQADVQPLNPKLLFKSTDKSLQSFQLSTNDSGFFDDQTMDTLPSTNFRYDELEKPTNERINMEEICFSKNGNNEESLPINNLSTKHLKKSKRPKRKH